MHTTVRGYLVKSVKSAIIRQFQKKSVLPAKTVDIGIEHNLNNEPELLQQNLANGVFLEEDMEAVVEKLPAKCQKVYRMSREEDLNTVEIAYRLKISPKTVKNHLTRALRLIRNESDLFLHS